jgi:hypothetical protein
MCMRRFSVVPPLFMYALLLAVGSWALWVQKQKYCARFWKGTHFCFEFDSELNKNWTGNESFTTTQKAGSHNLGDFDFNGRGFIVVNCEDGELNPCLVNVCCSPTTLSTSSWLLSAVVWCLALPASWIINLAQLDWRQHARNVRVQSKAN